MKSLIVDIKRNALDDGPGIRTLIFFKGCPLSCVWCQNPETQSIKQEIKFEGVYCAGCGKCVEVCEQEAINLQYKYRIKRDICNLCGRCIEVCPNQAYGFVGKEYSIEELMDIILKDKVFYDNTGGGVTFSGGEPTVHFEFLGNLLIELKKKGIHSCLETCGFFNLENLEKKLLPHLDLIYYDLKIFDPKEHEQYCGVSNEIIFKNFEYLIEKQEVKILPRIPLIPGITTSRQNLKKLKYYLKSKNIKKIGLLPYNPLWLSKPNQIGVELKYDYSKSLNKNEKIKIKEIFSEFEFNDF